MKKIRLTIIFMLIALNVWAADHYVSPTGSGTAYSYANPGSLSGVLTHGLVAGDTVYCLAGTYTITPRIVPVGSGTAGNPITITRYGTDAVTWTTNVSALEAIQLNHPYWTFSYMTWIDTHTGNTSSGDKAFLKLGESGGAAHTTIDHITATTAGGGDNYGIIHAKSYNNDKVPYLTITNCDMTAPSSGLSTNSTIICVVNGDYGVIEHNILRGGMNTYYVKHATPSESHNVFRYNWVKHTGGRAGFDNNGSGWIFEHNIFESSGTSNQDNPAMRFVDSSGGSSGNITNCIVRHNTFAGSMAWLYNDGRWSEYNTVEYNVFVRYQTYNGDTTTYPHYTTMDYNLVASGSSMREYYTGRTLAAWQAAKSGVYECTNCIAGAPTFVGGATPTTIPGYALTAASLGKGACPDGSDMGANVALVGPDTGEAPPPPTTNFTATPLSGASGFTVTFTDTSSGSPTSWAWDFDNNGSTDSTSQNPTHDYTGNGTYYSPKLTASNAYGSTSLTRTDYIYVNPQPAPVAAFTSDITSGTVPFTVNFTDTSTGVPTSWAWTFGDTGTSTEQNPDHEYTVTGTYTVVLTATNANGSDGETKTAYITANAPPDPPTANFTANLTSGTVPFSCDFSDTSTGSPTSWEWTFGTGEGTSTSQYPTHIYNTAGTYTVTLTASNVNGSDLETKTDYITVTNPVVVPVADFNAIYTSGWLPFTCYFGNMSTGATSYSWNFGDGATSTDENPTHIYTTTGIFTVVLTATNSVGNDVETKVGYITVTSPTVTGGKITGGKTQ